MWVVFLACHANAPAMAAVPSATVIRSSAAMHCADRKPSNPINTASVASETQRAHMNHDQSDAVNKPVPMTMSRAPMTRSSQLLLGNPYTRPMLSGSPMRAIPDARLRAPSTILSETSVGLEIRGGKGGCMDQRGGRKMALRSWDILQQMPLFGTSNRRVGVANVRLFRVFKIMNRICFFDPSVRAA